MVKIKNPAAYQNAVEKRQRQYDSLVQTVARRLPGVINSYFDGRLTAVDRPIALGELARGGALIPGEGYLHQAGKSKRSNRRQDVVNDALELAISEGSVIQESTESGLAYLTPRSIVARLDPEPEDFIGLIRGHISRKWVADYV